MKISLLYYSGAGNTKFIAKTLAKKLKEQSHEVKFIKITDSLAQNFDQSSELFIIGFPVYDLTSPLSVRALVNNLEISNKPIAFFCSKAFASADAILELAEVSEKKGMKNIAKTEFYMPGTDLLGLFAKKDSKTEKVVKFFHSRNIGSKLDRFIKQIEEQKVEKFSKKWYVYLSPFIPQKWKDAFHNQYNRFVPEFFSIDDRCIECMKCVKGCPRENIRFDEGIKFEVNCDMCLHCLHHCPTDSIQIGKFTEGTVRYTKVEIV
jgi:flavodoxin